MRNSLLMILIKLPLILIVEFLFPIFATYRAYRYWRQNRNFAKESLLVALIGWICASVVINFSENGYVLGGNLLSISAAIVYLVICMPWNDHLRDKISDGKSLVRDQ